MSRNSRLGFAAMFLIATMAATGMASAAENPGATAQAAQQPHRGVQARLQELHDALGIRADQRERWDALEATARKNHELMRQALLERRKSALSGTAIEDFAAYQKVAEIHLDNVRRLREAFAAFYQVLSPEQQKIADESLRRNALGEAGPSSRAAH